MIGNFDEEKEQFVTFTDLTGNYRQLCMITGSYFIQPRITVTLMYDAVAATI